MLFAFSKMQKGRLSVTLDLVLNFLAFFKKKFVAINFITLYSHKKKNLLENYEIQQKKKKKKILA